MKAKTTMPDISSPARDRVARNGRHPRHAAASYPYLVPGLVVFGLFAWYPIVRGVVLAVQNDNLVAPPTFVGLDNFTRVVHDAFFALAWRNTFQFTAFGLVIGYAVPLVLAIAMSEMRHAQSYLRLLAYIPVVLPPVVSVLLWKWFFDPGAGLFNQILHGVGLPTSQWIQSPSSAMVSLVLEATWATFGATTLIYIASLKGISGALYEAAELDGAGFFRRIWHVTMPQLRYLLLVTVLLQVIATMQVFTEPYVMTDGGPSGSTTTVALLIYNYAFVYNDYGSAAALSVLLALVLAVLTGGYLALTRRWSHD
jgi:multiple sugar transport system permease protein